MLDGVGQFPPGDELDVLFLEQLPECGAGEKIEIALAPGGAPCVTLARGGFILVSGEGRGVADSVTPGWRFLEGGLVETGHFLGRNAGIVGKGVFRAVAAAGRPNSR